MDKDSDVVTISINNDNNISIKNREKLLTTVTPGDSMSKGYENVTKALEESKVPRSENYKSISARR